MHSDRTCLFSMAARLSRRGTRILSSCSQAFPYYVGLSCICCLVIIIIIIIISIIIIIIIIIIIVIVIVIVTVIVIVIVISIITIDCLLDVFEICLRSETCIQTPPNAILRIYVCILLRKCVVRIYIYIYV